MGEFVVGDGDGQDFFDEHHDFHHRERVEPEVFAQPERVVARLQRRAPVAFDEPLDDAEDQVLQVGGGAGRAKFAGSVVGGGRAALERLA